MVKVVWSTVAINNRNEILKYWNNRNKSTNYSKKLRILISEAIQTIQAHPNIGKPTDRIDTRIKIVKDYFIIYRIKNEEIRIVDFWDSRQNPIKLENIIE